MLTPRQAAVRVGVSLSLVYELCQQKLIPHFRLGGKGRRGRILIEESDLAAFIQSCRVQAETDRSELQLKHIRL
jgi:excisionase family DNA binding protein